MIDIKKIENKTILVTGGAGFIGSNLCDKLLELGAYVISLDNYITGDIKNLAKSSTYKNFTNIEGDIRDYEVCKNATKGVDHVLHHAALGSVQDQLMTQLQRIKLI